MLLFDLESRLQPVGPAFQQPIPFLERMNEIDGLEQDGGFGTVEIFEVGDNLGHVPEPIPDRIASLLFRGYMVGTLLIFRQ